MAALECLLSDGYDREVFLGVVARHAAVKRTKERLERLFPHGEALLGDLFFALYKLNVVLRPEREISAAVLVHRRILESVLASRPLAELRRRTELSEAECAAALPILADSILAALTREYSFDAGALSRLAGVADDEEKIAALEAELAHLEALSQEGTENLPEKTALALKMSLEADLRFLKKKVEADRKAQSKLKDRLTTEIDDVVHQKLKNLPESIDQAAELVEQLGLGAGSDGRVSAEKRLELGDRLMRSKKLQLLARLVGAFREVALEARRKRIARAPEEIHEIRIGGEIERLLPSELLGLSTARRALHLDFLRRLAEGELLEYRLQSSSERGPMVVCLDGSGSMSGSKELWAKAVALTLMEIARREKRRAVGIIFSDGPELFEVELLDAKTQANGRARAREADVLRFAEHFPGGGTAFEPPLERAVALVSGDATGASGRRYKRGDIVFITDGEAPVSDALVEQVHAKRKKHRFSVRAVLIDSEGSRSDTLERFADDVRRVSDLTGDSVRDLFTAV